MGSLGADWVWNRFRTMATWGNFLCWLNANTRVWPTYGLRPQGHTAWEKKSSPLFMVYVHCTIVHTTHYPLQSRKAV